MTFLRYSRFTSSSLLLIMGDSGREELDGREGADDKESLTSGVIAELQ
jgi:hypothetical protein